MTEYGFLQVLQALSYFKCVSGPTGFRGSTFRAFEGLFEEVAGCDEAVCDVADFIENGANDSTIDWDGSFETELSQLFVNH